MRLTPWIAAALVVSLTMPAFAQPPSPQASASPAVAQSGGGEWDEHVFVEDGFKVNFPGKPQVENTTWESQYRYTLPARIYRASRGAERYSVTVVDYRPLEKLGPERSKQCPPGAETCIGTQDGRQGGILGLGYWKMDVRGALVYAALQFIQREGKVTEFNVEFQDVVEGYGLQLVNPDESNTFAYITMHENRLYVLEGTTPKGYPAPALFQGSMGFVDAQGRGIRYLDWYSNAVHGLRQHEPPARRVGGVIEGTPPPSAR